MPGLAPVSAIGHFGGRINLPSAGDRARALVQAVRRFRRSRPEGFGRKPEKYPLSERAGPEYIAKKYVYK
jgi:hypothetical protein